MDEREQGLPENPGEGTGASGPQESEEYIEADPADVVDGDVAMSGPGGSPQDDAPPGVPTKREPQGPMGDHQGRDGTWLSPDGDDDPQREEAAERARRAVEPGRERE